MFSQHRIDSRGRSIYRVLCFSVGELSAKGSFTEIGYYNGGQDYNERDRVSVQTPYGTFSLD